MCFLCPSLSLWPVVLLLVFVWIVLLGMERASFFFQVFLRILQSVVCSFLNSVIFMACNCSSPLQEIGRAVGVTLMKQCGWQADLRDPDVEVVVLVCQRACCCFQHCPWSLLFRSLLSLHSQLWPLTVCLPAAELNYNWSGSAEQSFLVAIVCVPYRTLK